MGMFGAAVDLQLLEHLAAQTVPWKHAPDGAAKRLFGLVGKELTVGTGPETTRVAGVVVDVLVGLLGTGQDHLAGVHDDDVVAGVDMGGEGGLVLAAEDRSHLGGKATEYQAISVDDVPRTLDLTCLGCIGGHGCSSRMCSRGARFRDTARSGCR